MKNDPVRERTTVVRIHMQLFDIIIFFFFNTLVALRVNGKVVILNYAVYGFVQFLSSLTVGKSRSNIRAHTVQIICSCGRMLLS